MRPIGLLGGTTPESTKAYYETIIELGREVLPGPLNNPVVLIYSINLSEVAELQQAQRTDLVVDKMADVFERLRVAGAEVGALTANTPHVNFDAIAARTKLPLVSILDSTFERARELGCTKVLLLGTQTTMSSDMYPQRFAAGGIEVLTPAEEERQLIDHTIYHELSVGQIEEQTRARYLAICQRRIDQDHVDGVILGCTEIPLLIGPGDLPVARIDTTAAHAAAIFAAARAGGA
jgi:aspartate racemase